MDTGSSYTSLHPSLTSGFPPCLCLPQLYLQPGPRSPRTPPHLSRHTRTATETILQCHHSQRPTLAASPSPLFFPPHPPGDQERQRSDVAGLGTGKERKGTGSIPRRSHPRLPAPRSDGRPPRRPGLLSYSEA